MRHPALFVFAALVAPALWIAFVGSFDVHELFVGGISSVLTVVFLTFVCRSSDEALTLRPIDLVQIWRVPWYVLVDAWVVTLVAFKDLLRVERAGSFYRVCGFDSSTHDPVRKARSILAIAYTTASPNTIVIGIDPAQSRMLFHQIRSSEISEMTRALGARSRGARAMSSTS